MSDQMGFRNKKNQLWKCIFFVPIDFEGNDGIFVLGGFFSRQVSTFQLAVFDEFF